MPAPARWSRRRRSCPTGSAGIVPGLADSKLLTAKARERCYAQVAHAARWPGRWWSSTSEECDRLGMHVANVEALRRALARLDVRPSYVLTDGFPVDGLEVPGLAVWKGDRVAACIAAASVLAKVTRDRIMTELRRRLPGLRLRDRTRATSPTCTPRRSTSTGRAPMHRHAVRERTAGRGARAGEPVPMVRRRRR